jgi:hypothetical protein
VDRVRTWLWLCLSPTLVVRVPEDSFCDGFSVVYTCSSCNVYSMRCSYTLDKGIGKAHHSTPGILERGVRLRYNHRSRERSIMGRIRTWPLLCLSPALVVRVPDDSFCDGFSVVYTCSSCNVYTWDAVEHQRKVLVKPTTPHPAFLSTVSGSKITTAVGSF